MVRANPRTIIEITGQDFVGKTTQADLLNVANMTFSQNLGGFGRYTDKFPPELPRRESWRWWFRDTDLATLGGAVMDAYNNRLKIAELSSHSIVIVERGEMMSRALLTANFATRREVEIDKVAEEVDDFVNRTILKSEELDSHEFCLLPSQDRLQKSSSLLAHARTFESSNGPYSQAENDFYNQYREKLGQALGFYSLKSPEQVHQIVVDESAIDIQNRIRNHEAIGHLALPSILDGDPVYIGIAGLSECGKTRVASELADKYGFSRFKIGFFNELTRSDSLYADPAKIATTIVSFLANNKHIKRATFESLYTPSLASNLKLMLGRRWNTLYIDTSSSVRQQRALDEYPAADTEELLQGQLRKDSTKISAGVPIHQQIADLVVNNDGSIDETIQKILKGVSCA